MMIKFGKSIISLLNQGQSQDKKDKNVPIQQSQSNQQLENRLQPNRELKHNKMSNRTRVI